MRAASNRLPGRGDERHVQADDVGARDQFVERDRSTPAAGIDADRRRRASDRRRSTAHAEPLRQLRRQPADRAEADHAERLAGDLAAFRQRAARPARRRRPRRSTGRRRAAAASPRRSTYSATASALAPVAGMTAMPRAAQASTSMLSRPTPSRPTTRSGRAAASSAPCTWVRLRTINASAGRGASAQTRRVVDQRRRRSAPRAPRPARRRRARP